MDIYNLDKVDTQSEHSGGHWVKDDPTRGGP